MALSKVSNDMLQSMKATVKIIAILSNRNGVKIFAIILK
jgi:hypothetical protein